MSTQYLLFAEADSTLEDAHFCILGVPFDKTCSYRPGSRFAPNSIRDASYNIEAFFPQHGIDMEEVPIYDHGNTDEFGDVTDMVMEVESIIDPWVKAGKFPVVLGGEHSLSPAVVRCFDDVGVISIDAHLDYRQEYLGKSNSHACSTARIADHVGVENIVPIGVRSVSKGEWERAHADGLKYITASDVRKNGIEKMIQEALDHLGKEKIFLTIDIDGIDPSYAPGVGTPEPFGLTDLDVKKAIDILAPRLVGCDLVEVCPPADQGNTAVLAARLIDETMAAVWKAKA